MSNFLTFADLYTQVCNLIGDDNQSKIDQVKAVINQVYLNELLPADTLYPPYWLCKPGIKQIIAPATITAIVAADPPVITCDAAHGHSVGDLITIWGVVGMTEVNSFGADYPTFDASVRRVGTISTVTVANDSFQLLDIDGSNVIGAGYTAWSSGGTVLHQGWALSTIDKVISMGIYGGNPLTRTSPERIIESTKAFWTDSQSTPAEYFNHKRFTATGTEANDLHFGPGASQAKRMLIWHQVQADRLTAVGNVPLLPYNFHPAIVSGSITRLAESPAQVENAVIWPGIYAADIEALVAHNREWWKQYERDNPGKPYGLI